MWSVRRSRQADASLIVFGFAALAAAAAAVYLLIVGAVAAVAGLVHLAKTHTARRRSGPDGDETMSPTFEPAPSTDYQQLLDVEPLATSEHKGLTAAALAIFAAWARALPKGPRSPASIVRRVQPVRRLLVRQDTWTEGRRFGWRSMPFEGRGKAGAPPVQPSQMDAWSPPGDLMDASRYIASCETCTKTGRVTCRECSGEGKVPCVDCRGAGKVHGRTANGHQRLLNCKACGGTGCTTCVACSRGKVECPACHGAKRVERWLDVEVWNRQDVQVEPDDYQRVFLWSRDGQVSTTRQMEQDAFVVDQVALERPLNRAEAPPSIPTDDRDRVLAAVQAQLQPGERITRQQLTVLEFPVVGVTYGIGDDEQTIELMGRRLLAPSTEVDTVLRERSRLLNWVGGALAVAPILVASVYVSRGPYFTSPEVAGLVASVLAAAIVAFLVLWHLTIGRRSAIKFLGLVPVPLAAAAVLGFLAEPSLDDAKAHVKAGRLDAAEVELRALGPETARDLRPVWADIRLQRVNRETDVEKARALVGQLPADLPQHEAATKRVDALVFADAQAALAAGRAPEVEELLRRGSERMRESQGAKHLVADAELVIGQDCLKRDDYRCAVERATRGSAEEPDAASSLREQALGAYRERVDQRLRDADTKDLGQRVRALAEATSLLSDYELLTQPDASQVSDRLSGLRQRLARDQAALDKQRAAEERRLAAQRAVAEAKERREAERENRRRAAEDRSESRSRGGGCCKYCSKGQPCGDTCISRNKTCHVGGGCAC